MRVVAPADAQELRSCLRTALQQDHPVYIRIGKKGEPQVFKEPPIFEFGNWSLVRPASGNTAILATGVMLAVALETALELAKEGIDARVYSSSSIKPLDEDVLDREFGDCSVVSTIEEHGLTGGFGSAVAEWMADRWPRPGARLLRFGCRDEFLHYAGNQDEARESCGLTVAHISTSLRSALSTGVAAPSLTLLHN
jgi:transketolase